MNKDLLDNYMDACALIEETKEDIRRLQQKRTEVQDVVKGSMAEWPYIQKNIHISGFVEDPEIRAETDRKLSILQQRKANAEKIQMEVEEALNGIPMRMQRIIRFKIFQRRTWEETAMKMGGRCTGESVKKEFQRFMEAC